MGIERGIQMPAGDGPTNRVEMPHGHTRVCFAAYQGMARRGRADNVPREETLRLAVELLTTNPEECLCPKPKVRRGRRG